MGTSEHTGEPGWSVVLGHGFGPLELGQTLPECVSRLQREHVVERDDEHPLRIYLSDLETQLTFWGEPPLLVQIAVSDARVRFGSEPVLGRPLHEIATLLQVDGSETVWRVDQDPDQSLPHIEPEEPFTVSDRDLLDVGTLWIRPLGLGLNLQGGKIAEIYLRQPAWSPRTGVGPLTPRQLDLSQRGGPAAEPGPAEQRAAQIRRRYRLVTGVVFFSLIAYVVFQAADYQRRWQRAIAVEADVIAVGAAPPGSVPRSYTVQYQDRQGNERQANLTLADVVTPQAVGNRVVIRYLPEEPGKPLGAGRIPDAAFVKFFPWGIGILAAYLVSQVAGAILIKTLTTPSRPRR